MKLAYFSALNCHSARTLAIAFATLLPTFAAQADNTDHTGPQVEVPHTFTQLPADQLMQFGDTTLTRDAYHQLIAALPPRFAEYEQRKSPDFALSYVKNRVLADAARQKGLETDRNTAARLRMAQDEVLAASLAQQLADGYQPNDATLQGYFNAHRSDYTRYKLSHILIRCADGCRNPADKTKALAKIADLQHKLASGADFAQLAETQSEDQQTASDGGAIDQALGRFIAPAFKDAVLKLKIGQVTPPVASAYGYHLIKLTNLDAPDFAQSRTWVLKEMQDAYAKAEMENLTRKANIRLNRLSFDPVVSGGSRAKAPL